MSDVSLEELLHSELRVVNVGVESFASELASRGVPVAHVNWSPPGDAESAKIASLLGVPGERTNRIDAANQVAVRRMLEADPVLVDVVPAQSVIPQLVD